MAKKRSEYGQLKWDIWKDLHGCVSVEYFKDEIEEAFPNFFKNLEKLKEDVGIEFFTRNGYEMVKIINPYQKEDSNETEG